MGYSTLCMSCGSFFMSCAQEFTFFSADAEGTLYFSGEGECITAYVHVVDLYVQC